MSVETEHRRECFVDAPDRRGRGGRLCVALAAVPSPDPPVPAWPIRALIEGFYGQPWSWDDRLDVMGWCHQRGMTHYLYAPKDDALHRDRWRELYDPTMVAGFERLVASDTLQVGFAISPGLSIDYRSADDRTALAAKVDQVVGLGIDLVALLFDDIPVRPGLGPEHAEITTWLRGHLDGRADLILTPTEYTGTRSTTYLDALAAGVPDDVLIGWTGDTVVADEITTDHAQARARSLGDRPPFVWDNYPVNDAVMADRLFLGPLRGRAADLGSACSGYAANPMVQPMASKPALASIAGYLRGEDPMQAWVDDIGDLRIFAEACDGEVPRRLVADALAAGSLDASLDELERWLRAARGCEAPGLDGEADAWLEQVHAEAAAGVVAVKLLRDLAGARAQLDDRALALAILWPALRRSAVTVMGARCSFRPVMAQGPGGHWVWRPEAIADDQNAIDALIRAALERMPEGR
jgi:hypothetical protein